MKIHREGKSIILLTFGVTFLIWFVMLLFVHHWTPYHYIFLSALVLFDLLVASFFRIPRRIFTENETELIDGDILDSFELWYKIDYRLL